MKYSLQDDTNDYTRKDLGMLIKGKWFENMFDRKCVSSR